MTKINFEDWGLIPYDEAWQNQEQRLQDIIEAKKAQTPSSSRLIFCEHPHVYTLGKSGAAYNLLINEAFLKNINATYYQTNRGGDITYHGPGQLVGYPILDLETFGFQVKRYIDLLEESIIKTIAHWDIKGERMEGATGVWIDADQKGKARKICAMGVRVSRWVTMHGFALNVNTDLSYFNHINPCGFVDKGVTSIEKELGKKCNFVEVKSVLKKEIATVFNMDFA